MKTQNSKSRILHSSRAALTVFEVIPLFFVLFGTTSGLLVGDQYGGLGLMAGSLVGGIIGWCCWRIIFFGIYKLAELNSGFRRKSNEQLRAMLRDPHCKNPTLVLLELGVRKQNMEQELPVIYEMLISPIQERRRRGWFTLASVFPEQAKLISDYRSDDSVEICREKIQQLLTVQK